MSNSKLFILSLIGLLFIIGCTNPYAPPQPSPPESHQTPNPNYIPLSNNYHPAPSGNLTIIFPKFIRVNLPRNDYSLIENQSNVAIRPDEHLAISVYLEKNSKKLCVAYSSLVVVHITLSSMNSQIPEIIPPPELSSIPHTIRCFDVEGRRNALIFELDAPLAPQNGVIQFIVLESYTLSEIASMDIQLFFNTYPQYADSCARQVCVMNNLNSPYGEMGIIKDGDKYTIQCTNDPYPKKPILIDDRAFMRWCVQDYEYNEILNDMVDP